ncbi:GTP-binding protein [Paenibacillus sp. NFR01]|uniref:CobW family GTP-binding protein n=1 Tax=Paenibacillus sp. NFR01 TaxID=1566279 RepID=UPI0008AF74BD|nr:GTP-binding protein [Paenibacillus sp. NFR01]SES98415.1 GTPase, G3E family [Paenibacillus sp. NFR01]
MKVPVIVLSGFLGSGKTTLLLSLLNECTARGLKPGVLMNELGKKDVDGYILQEQTGANVEKLLDGCICCGRKEDLPRSFAALLTRRPDIIFIELTGVANPEEIAAEIKEGALNARIALHYTVCVLDAENTLEYASRLASDKAMVRTLRGQMAAADLIVVNRSDLVPHETLWRIEKTARKANAQAEIVFTHYSRINSAPLFAGIPRKEAVDGSGPKLRRAAEGGALRVSTAERPERPISVPRGTGPNGPVAEPSYSQVAAVTLTFPERKQASVIAREQLESFFREWSGQLLRAKGHVQLGEREPVQLVQFAGDRTTWETSRYPGQPYVVFIGLNLDEKRLTERWTSLFA